MMNKKIGTTLLFVISFLVLIALQSYYLYNSYLLEKKDLNKKVQLIASEVLTQLEKYESESSEDSLIMSLKKLSSNQQFMNQKISEKKQWYHFKNFYESQVDSILAKETINTDFKIALKSEIYSVFDETKKKDLLPNKAPLILFKTKAPISEGFVFNEGKWNSNFSEKDTELKVDEHYHYIIRSRTSAELLNANYLIFKKILPLSLVSLSIILLLTYLFWRTLKNLKLQQLKISQLYTSIDSIAHELNTPLTTVKFTLASTPDSDMKQLLDRQIQRLEKVVSSIHNSSSDSELLLKTDVDSYVSNISKRFDQIKLQTVIEFNNNETLLKSDFEQILNNLVENSVKYKASEVKVNLQFGKQIYIEIADNGIGIPEEAQPYIFDKYYRVSRPENLQINGLGLGLYIIKQIVEKYSGNIKVSSNELNGVTFKITLPNA
ncbi:sensor histidine kinase [Pedobacter sp. SL55]|uniref:sensor histidine kinase n=1 Tax=Pedobacter sp. SL55 TaxID=2995161 RepID=UPI00226F5AF1|nr:HAMP domain-containing sensor histidine kinase [Pedobacter sp. SL55]WAC39504.1 HAMP domain-containing sensor histidine kinase [Pedobacter sp. SL55]